jgi:hypothetical protein
MTVRRQRSENARVGNSTAAQREHDTTAQDRERVWDEILKSFADVDSEEQRRLWLEFQRAIDEDRVGDQKYYLDAEEER